MSPEAIFSLSLAPNSRLPSGVESLELRSSDQSRYDRIQVDDLLGAAKDVVPVQMDVTPRRRRNFFEHSQCFRVANRLVLRE